MRRSRVVVGALMVLVDALGLHGAAYGDEKEKNGAVPTVETVPDAVRVTLVKSGGEHVVSSVSGGGTTRVGCAWRVVFVDDLDQVPYGTSVGPKPDPEARLGLLLCNGMVVRPLWVSPADVIDLDAAARVEAQRYVEHVLTPAVRIGVNPAARGLAGLDSWFWIEGFDGSVSAPPIRALGVTIDVRMTSGAVSWDFGDGTVEAGDLGRAYPQESTVRHVHQHDGTYVITASIALVPEYRVDGGPWLALPNLSAVATTTHPVEQRQAVVTQT
jgi:hypothetical protein